jgi:hypothetical protein
MDMRHQMCKRSNQVKFVAQTEKRKKKKKKKGKRNNEWMVARRDARDNGDSIDAKL